MKLPPRLPHLLGCLLLSAIAPLALAQTEQADPLVQLTISPDTLIVGPGRNPELSAVLYNGSDVEMLLVAPGEGSLSHVTTPQLSWSVVSRPGDQDWEWSKGRPRGGFCGNIDHLRIDRILILAPGDSASLDPVYVLPPRPLARPGVSWATLHYRNLPDFEWDHGNGAPPDSVLPWVRASLPFDIQSNEIVVIWTDENASLNPD